MTVPAAPAPTAPAVRATRRAAPLVVVGAVAAAAAFAAAVLLAERAATLLADPGPLVRAADPALSAAGHLVAAACIGALVLASVALPVTGEAATVARRIAAVAGVVWTLSWTIGIVTAYATVSGTPLGDPAFGSGLQLFVTSFEVGQYLLAGALLAALATTLAVAATGPALTGLATVAALAALVPPALSGHSGSAADHEVATTSMGMHLVGVTVWVGGLAVLGLLHGRLGTSREAVTARYSGLALVAAGLVVLSGVLNASTRISGWEDLTTRYGTLTMTKVGLTALLLAAGAAHRAWTLRAMQEGRDGAFRRLLAGEVVVMATVIGVAVALATTAPPVSETDAPEQWSLGEVVAGFPVPAEPTLAGWLTGWQPDVLWLVLAAAAAYGYVAGYRRLRRRGDAWPVWRLALFLAGLALLTWVTSGGPAVYGRWAFSTHMLQHMLLAMFVPMLLVGGAPILLALRSLEPRRDGSRGPREWLLAVVHSPVSRFLTHPVVAATIFVVGMAVFYYSPLFSLALRTHLGHELMIVHFLATGYLFAWVMFGADPGARPVPYPFKLLLLFATMAFHAFFGIAIAQGDVLLAPDYFVPVAADRPWGADLLEDQRLGAAWAWGLGEIPMVAHVIIVAVLWARSDTREARRSDRRADRDGDAAHEAYNAYLAGLADPSAPPAPHGPERAPVTGRTDTMPR